MAVINVNKTYENLEDFLRDLFYKNPTLAKPAYIFLQKIAHYGKLDGRNWKDHIMEMFNIDPPENSKLKLAKQILQTYNAETFTELIKKLESNEINLSEEEIQIVKEANNWNKIISAYYSILKKFISLGIIKKEGFTYYFNIEEFKNKLNSILTVLGELE